MPRNEASVEIARPAGDVFPYLLATDRRLRWMGALAESEKLSDGEPRLGTRFRDVFEDQGQRIEIDAEVVEWEPNARVATRLRSSAFEATARQTLEEVDGRTLVRTTIETEYRSRIARMMAGVITRHAQRRLEEDLKALKRLVEGGG